MNYEGLFDANAISSKYEIERIIPGIISHKMGIPVNEIEPHHRIVYDLGIE